MNEIAEGIQDHAWVWADVMAWAAGTAGEVCTLLAQRLYALENILKPR